MENHTLNENYTLNEVLSTSKAAFSLLAKSLQTQANLQSNLGNMDLANQLQEQSNKVIGMTYYVNSVLKGDF